MKLSRVLPLLVFTALAFAAGSVAAQYPARAVRIVTTSAPGTAPDLYARTAGAYLQQSLGQPFVIETRTGGGGNLAAESVARAAPDGYTLLVSPDPVFVTNPHLYKKLSFDSLKELVPVSPIMSQAFALIVNLAVPARSVQEFIEHAKRTKPPLFYGTAGAGTASHLAMEILKAGAGINLVHVPFQGGGAPLMAALISGEVAVTIGGTAALAQVKAGKLAAIGTTGPRRSPHNPDFQPIAEAVPGFEMVTWLGLFAPAAVPGDVLGRLRAGMNAYLALPDTRQKFAAGGGADPMILKPEEFAALIRRENERYGRIIKELGVSVD